MADKEIYLKLNDAEWPLEYIDHERTIARAIVYDEEGFFHFVHVERDDEFGHETTIETSGGGVEPGENLQDAIRRELKEELGVQVTVMDKIGVVDDYYNLIHRHNISHYYLCKAESFGENHLTLEEQTMWNLSPIRLTYEEAIREYQSHTGDRLGRLIANRELPVLQRAHELLEKKQNK